MGQKQGQKIERVMVLGAGGVGFWLTVALARDLNLSETAVTLLDWDTVEGSGGRRLPKAGNPDVFKVDLLRSFIAFTMGDRPPEMKKEALYSINAARYLVENPGTSLLVDCTDMPLRDREPLWRAMAEQGWRCVRVSYDGNGVVVFANGLPLVPVSSLGGYTHVPSLAQSMAAGGIGAAAVTRICDGWSVADFQVNVNTGECMSTWEER